MAPRRPRRFLDLLAPDVVLMGDGGGVKQAVLRPVVGADRVARLLAAGLPNIVGDFTAEPIQVNGSPALLLRQNGEIEQVVAVHMQDGLISGVYVVRNPEKLSHLEEETTLLR